jgi:hypothetical protein
MADELEPVTDEQIAYWRQAHGLTPRVTVPGRSGCWCRECVILRHLQAARARIADLEGDRHPVEIHDGNCKGDMPAMVCLGCEQAKEERYIQDALTAEAERDAALADNAALLLEVSHPGQALLDRMKKMEEALRFYASQGNALTSWGNSGDAASQNLLSDRGKIARAALKETP